MKRYYLLFILIMLCSYFVNAEFGVVSRYHETNSLIVQPGETIETYFKIQNTIGETKDVTVETLLEEGFEIATITNGPLFDIKAGEQQTVNLQINIPLVTEIGTEYTIKALFVPSITTSGQEMIDFQININKEFKIIVGEEKERKQEGEEYEEESKEKSSNLAWILIVAIIIVSIITIILIIIKRKKDLYNQNPYANTNP